MYLGLLLLFNNLKVIFVPYIYSKKIDTMQSDQLNYIPILMQFVLAVGFVVNHYSFRKTRSKRSSEVKAKNFECGIESVGNARIPFSVKYFSYIICFV
jgi:NADH-quinone oxidoreductase subunit A